MTATIGSAMQEGKDNILRMMDENDVSTDIREAFVRFADYWHHEISELAASGRAMDRLCAAHGWMWEEHLSEYMAYHAEESRAYDGDYLTEWQRQELAEEAEQTLGEQWKQN